MYCQRLARAATGKPKILKFEGAYHGANEAGVTSLFPVDPPDFPQPALTSAGTPAAGELLLVAPFNDLPTTRALIEAHSHELAGVIIEPLQRCLSPRPGFLEGVRQACSDAGVLLIFDEVVTGFRLAYGGAQEYYRVTPDLVAYGKALGGGYPIGVFGGRADIMAWVEESRMGRGDYVRQGVSRDAKRLPGIEKGRWAGVGRWPAGPDRLFRSTGLRLSLGPHGRCRTVAAGDAGIVPPSDVRQSDGHQALFVARP
jgi:glutamate-1-semialdehyde 2,1-aminomutase